MEVASLVARFSVEGERAIPNAAMAADRAIDKVGDSADRNTGRVGGFFSGMGGLLLGGALIGGVGALGGALLSASANAETMRISFDNAVGDLAESERKFKWIQDMAASSPFEFPELANAATMMESFGTDSTKWLTTIGDAAAGMNKPIEQITEAVLDAQLGNFMRLEELGIEAKKEGDKLTFSYKENGQTITETVDATNQDVIDSTIQGIWNKRYEGMMDKQAASFTGQWSTLKDTVKMAAQTMFAPIFSAATKLLGFMNNVFANGWTAAVEATFGGTFLGGVLSGIGDFAGGVKTLLGDVWEAFEHGRTVKEIVADLPTWLQPIATEILTIADSLGDLWGAYKEGGTQGFFDALGTEARTIAESGIDLGKILVKGTYELGGMLLTKLWDWVAEKITGKTGVSHQEMIQGKGNPGDTGHEVPIGEVLVTGSYKLSDKLLAFDAWLTEQLGGFSTEASQKAAFEKGRQEGRAVGEAMADGSYLGIEEGSRSGKKDTKWWSGLADDWALVQDIWNWEPPWVRDQGWAPLDNLIARASGWGAGLREKIMEGIGLGFGSDVSHQEMIQGKGKDQWWIQDWADSIIGAFDTAWTTISSTVGQTIDSILAIFDPLTNWSMPTVPGWLSDPTWITGPIDDLAGALNTAIGPLQSAWDKFMALKEAIEGIGGGSGGAPTGGANSGTGAIGGSGVGGGASFGGFEMLWTGGADIAEKAAGDIADAASSVIDSVEGIVRPTETTSTAVQRAMQDMATKTVSVTTQGMMNAARAVDAGTRAMLMRAEGLRGPFGAAAIAAMATFNSGQASGWVTAAGMAAAGAAVVGRAATPGSLYSPGFDVGQSLGSGIADGIRSMIGAIAQAGADAANAGRSGATFGTGRALTPSAAPMRATAGFARSQAPTVVYDLRGAVIGDNAERWIEQKVAAGASKVMDRAYSRNRMAEAR